MSIWSAVYLLLAIGAAALAFFVLNNNHTIDFVLQYNAIMIAKGSLLIFTVLFLVSLTYKRV